MEIKITGGQMHDSCCAIELLQDKKADFVVADKAYDSNAMLNMTDKMGAECVIPPMPQRRDQREYNKQHYKERNLIERFFNKLKHFRRIATRYEKKLSHYLALTQFAASMIWMR